MNPQISQYDPAQPAESLFDLLGGRAAIAAVVERLYKHIMNDEELRPYFARSDMTRLKGQQVDFFTALTGGPAQYRGAPLKQAHSHIPVSGAQFDRVAGHLAAAMRELGVSQPLIDATLAALAPARRAVVNTPESAAATSDQAPGASAARLSRPQAEPRGASHPPLSIEMPTSAAQLGPAPAPAAPPPAPAAHAGHSSVATLAGPPSPAAPAASAPPDPLSDGRFLRAALDGVPSPVLLSDPALNIIYCNERALRAAEEHGEGFRQALGAGDGLVGASIAAFCGDPGAAAQAFAAPSLPWEMRVTVGGCVVQARVNGVFGPQNALRGYIVQWEPIIEPPAEEEAPAEAAAATPAEAAATAHSTPRLGAHASAQATTYATTHTTGQTMNHSTTHASHGAPEGPAPGAAAADGTDVSLTVNGSTIKLVLSEGELSVQFIVPTKDGGGSRAVALRIGAPT